MALSPIRIRGPWAAGISMSKTFLVRAVALQTRQSKRAVAKTVDAFLECLTDILGGQGKATLTGFGSFRVRKRAARRARHIRTGELISIPASRVVRFKAASRLKRAIH